MNKEQKAQEQSQQQGRQEQQQAQDQAPAGEAAATDVDGLKDKKPEELTPDELRLMADTMPGEGPGD